MQGQTQPQNIQPPCNLSTDSPLYQHASNAPLPTPATSLWWSYPESKEVAQCLHSKHCFVSMVCYMHRFSSLAKLQSSYTNTKPPSESSVYRPFKSGVLGLEKWCVGIGVYQMIQFHPVHNVIKGGRGGLEVGKPFLVTPFFSQFPFQNIQLILFLLFPVIP